MPLYKEIEIEPIPGPCPKGHIDAKVVPDGFYKKFHVICKVIGCWSGPDGENVREAILAWNEVSHKCNKES